MPRHSRTLLPVAPGRRNARRLAARSRAPRGESPVRLPAARECAPGSEPVADSIAPASPLSISSWYAISGTAMA